MDVPAVDDPRVQVRIPLPVKGRKQPLVLVVPRFDFIEEPVLDEMTAAIEAIDNTLIPRKVSRAVILAMLKPVTPSKDYAVCETLTGGQLEAVREIWDEQSRIPLGEYMASGASSTGNTEAPSNTTSSSAATTDVTSDAA